MCFNEGTKILCFRAIPEYREEYVPIESLRVGDLVKTFRHGYRRIAMIGKGTMKNDVQNIWECMYKYGDLIITGGHGILYDSLTNDEYHALSSIYRAGILQIDEKYLVFANHSRLFTKMQDANKYTYYHFSLESDGDDYRRFGVWANGVLTETTTINHFIQHNYTPL